MDTCAVKRAREQVVHQRKQAQHEDGGPEPEDLFYELAAAEAPEGN